MNPILITTGILAQVITNIGISALVSSITSITHTSENIYNLVNRFSFSKSKEKNKIYNNLKELDLETTIKILNLELNEINKEKVTSKSIILCIESIQKVILDIEKELLNIDKMTNYNESLLVLQKFRSYDCSQSIKILKSYKTILDNRRKLLNETLQNNFFLKHNFNIEINDNCIIEERKLLTIIINNDDTAITNNYFTDLL